MYIEQVEGELYQLKKEGQSIGSFRLIQLAGGAGKLEQLQVKDHISPGRILELFEIIQSYVEETGFSELHVESHSDTLDFLLQHQQFKRKDVEKRLWIYEINHN
ncbi:hypothetical protein SAMN05192559_101543 [Halobacillus karajensis]|uniref:N-acetyltransferase domain-containing protein n=1 Tax=Halobacillus karajensis TaxID=195088 RepID=A0A024P545_9BACI|nr:hypothetical protein [Halobacillus karajensis]CDQ18820.1 hypothetical protein BN982_01101 [Halobacillus karajensis]CDQ23107.1 hypothetical protein BN983_01326 [Halobacillus karajensis]CDQ26589.1 hypothetical protein BN981_00806 [Halobacillus karajensis]SEH45707.1 hypothetical protein SAMN05192559_101543 [Halobacillus karajensis]